MSVQTDLIRVEDLRVAFMLHGSPLEVVKGISFRIKPGSVVALVGESGSGKSVTAQALLGILPRSASITGGKILFQDPDIEGQVVDIASLHRDSSDMRELRGSRISMIFQEPMTALNPVHTIGNQIAEGIRLHTGAGKVDALERTKDLLERVGLPTSRYPLTRYPHELSGGQRQRIAIARVLLKNAPILVLDEATSALDSEVEAAIQDQLVNLMDGKTVIAIAHRLSTIAAMDRLIIMDRGAIVEDGSHEELLKREGLYASLWARQSGGFLAQSEAAA